MVTGDVPVAEACEDEDEGTPNVSVIVFDDENPSGQIVLQLSGGEIVLYTSEEDASIE